MSTDADVVRDGQRRRLLLLTLGGLALSVPLSIIMGALAEVLVALAAVPIALVLTRDGYVTTAALSYGPFAASRSLLWLAIATGLWSVVAPLILAQRHRLVALLGGAGVVVLGYVLASYSATVLPLTRVHELSLSGVWQGGGLVIAVGAGGLAGVISVRRTGDLIQSSPTNKELFMHLSKHLALFAFCLAFCLEISVAAVAALNRF